MLNSSTFVHLTLDRRYMSLNLLSILVCCPCVHGLNELSANNFYDLSVNVLYLIPINIFTCDLWSLHELSANGLYDLSINVLYLLFINVCPGNVRDLHELSANGMNVSSVHICSHDLVDSGDITSESGLHGLNGLNSLGC